MKTLISLLNEAIAEGERGDWQKEGYTISHVVSDDGNSIDIKAMLNGKVVGQMDAGKSTSEPGKLNPTMIKIDPEHRRKGLATAMYQRAEEILKMPFKKGSYQSPEAQALWKQKNRPFGNS